MAVPTFSKIRMAPEASGTSRIIETPVGALAGQTLQIGIGVTGGATISTPPGWKQLLQTAFFAETVAIFQLPNWNGTTTSYTIEWGGVSHFSQGAIVSYAGAD